MIGLPTVQPCPYGRHYTTSLSLNKFAGAAPLNSTVQEPTDSPTTIWRDPTLWLSVGVAAIVLGMQGMRVGLFDRILGQWLTTHEDDGGIQVSTNNTLENGDVDD